MKDKVKLNFIKYLNTIKGMTPEKQSELLKLFDEKLDERYAKIFNSNLDNFSKQRTFDYDKIKENIENLIKDKEVEDVERKKKEQIRSIYTKFFEGIDELNDGFDFFYLNPMNGSPKILSSIAPKDMKLPDGFEYIEGTGIVSTENRDIVINIAPFSDKYKEVKDKKEEESKKEETKPEEEKEETKKEETKPEEEKEESKEEETKKDESKPEETKKTVPIKSESPRFNYSGGTYADRLAAYAREKEARPSNIDKYDDELLKMKSEENKLTAKEKRKKEIDRLKEEKGRLYTIKYMRNLSKAAKEEKRKEEERRRIIASGDISEGISKSLGFTDIFVITSISLIVAVLFILIIGLIA